MTSDGNTPAPLPSLRRVYIGFNYFIDKQSISKLMSAIGVILERKPRPEVLVLCISSDGGALDQAFYAYDILRGLPVGVATINVGTVASAALVLFMAGNVRLAAPHTTFLFHEPKFTPAPVLMREQELEYTLSNLRHYQRKLEGLIAEKTGASLGVVKGWARGEKMRDAEFALSQKVISGIEGPIIGATDEFLQITL
jgi:ATP-dependent protease ClpP protease subunit